jgi:hypothetical protein
LLKAAPNEHEVLALVRSYLQSWTQEEIALLPSDIWPGPISSRRDIIDWTFRIGKAHADFNGSAGKLELLQELLLFMTQASVRVTQLSSTGDNTQIATEPEEGIGGPVPEAGNKAAAKRSKA